MLCTPAWHGRGEQPGPLQMVAGTFPETKVSSGIPVLEMAKLNLSELRPIQNLTASETGVSTEPTAVPLRPSQQPRQRDCSLLCCSWGNEALKRSEVQLGSGWQEQKFKRARLGPFF